MINDSNDNKQTPNVEETFNGEDISGLGDAFYPNASEEQIEMVEEIDGFEAFLGIFVHPVQTMKRLIYSPKMLMAIITLVICSVISIALNFSTLLAASIDMLTVTYESMGITLSTSDIAATAKFSLYGSFALVPLLNIVGWLIFSAIILILIKIFGAKRAAYKQVQTIMANALYIKSISLLLSGIIGIVTGLGKFTFSLGFLYLNLVEEINMNLYLLLSAVDIFMIWEYFVIGCGVYVLGGFSKKKTFLLMCIAYTLNILYSFIFG
jgi:hypothetical protein